MCGRKSSDSLTGKFSCFSCQREWLHHLPKIPSLLGSSRFQFCLDSLEASWLLFLIHSCLLQSILHTVAKVILLKWKAHVFTPCLSNLGDLPSKMWSRAHTSLVASLASFLATLCWWLVVLKTHQLLENCPARGTIHLWTQLAPWAFAPAGTLPPGLNMAHALWSFRSP